MRVAVISDIHGNAHALDAVLAAIDAERVDAVWCLGDLVGYGPRPNRCTRAAAAHADACLAGNHDLGVLGSIDISDFSPDASASARWTRDVLDPDAREFLAGLVPERRLPRADLFHASPRDPVWEYVLSADAAEAALAATEARVVLVGHTHVALAVLQPDAAPAPAGAPAGSTPRAAARSRAKARPGAISGGLAPAGHEVDLGRGRWLLNPGSVGQPRDGDPRAAWLLLDFRAGRGVFRRTGYDIAATQAEIRERGLPENLAVRLALGG